MTSLPIEQTSPTPKKSNKTVIIGIIIVVILCCCCAIVGAVAGYFGFQNINPGELIQFENNPPSDENSPDATIAPQKKPTKIAVDTKITPQEPAVQPIKPPEESASGKEIRNEKGGYAFTSIPGYKLTLDSIVPEDIPMWDKDKDILKCITEGPFISLVGSLKTDVTIEESAKFNIDNFMIKQKKKGTTISDEQQTSVSIAGLEGKAYDIDYEVPDIGKIKFRMILVEVNPKQRFMIECYSPVDNWDKTRSDCEAVTNSLTFFDAKPK
jgi:hypothetical protein